MGSLTIGLNGELRLPPRVRQRYRLAPETPLRLIETRRGILLIPLTQEPMDPELASELEEWQSLGAAAWERFPYEDPDA